MSYLFSCLQFHENDRTNLFSKPDFVVPWLFARCPHQCQPPSRSSVCKTNALFPKINLWYHCKITTNLWHNCKKKITSVCSSWHGRTSSDASQGRLAGRGRRGRQGTRSTVPLSPGSGDYKSGCVWLTVSDPPSPSSKFFTSFFWPKNCLTHLDHPQSFSVEQISRVSLVLVHRIPAAPPVKPEKFKNFL